MADITFTQLGAEANASISVANGLMTIDLQKLTGEAGLTADSHKVAEFFTNMLDAAHDASVKYNNDPVNAANPIGSYASPNSGIPTRDATTGDLFVVSTYTFQSQAPLQRGNISAVAG